MRKNRGVCAGCHARLARYTIVSPETGQIAYVCDRCETNWSHLPERKTVTEWELAMQAGERIKP